MLLACWRKRESLLTVCLRMSTTVSNLVAWRFSTCDVASWKTNVFGLEKGISSVYGGSCVSGGPGCIMSTGGVAGTAGSGAGGESNGVESAVAAADGVDPSGIVLKV